MALSFEQRIKDEYHAVTAFIMLHPYVSVLGAAAVGWLLGHLF